METRNIIIRTGELELKAELNDSMTAGRILENLPLEGSANVWGDEIYFTIPLHVDQAGDAIEEVEVGALGFWPLGDAFCIFFGRTPLSNGDKPRAYSPVNVFGKIPGDPAVLRSVSHGDRIQVLKAG